MALQDLTPQLRTRLSRMERAVGWFVILATLLLAFGFGYYVYNVAERKGWFLKKITYQTCVSSGAGLKIGDPVKLMGFDVGEITAIIPNEPYDYYNITIQFRIKLDRYNYPGYVWSDSTVKVNAQSLLGSRYLEITKGVQGIPTVLETTNNELLGVLRGDKIIKARVQEIEKQGHSNAEALALLNKEVRSKSAAYYTNELRGHIYFLDPEESPAITERLDKLISQVENALPNILNLTNQLATVLANTTTLTSNLNEVAVGARPVVSNLSFVTAQLNGPGTLGDWLLPTNVNQKLNSVLSGADVTLANASTNLESLNLSLLSLADLTSNLNYQVQMNTNILGEISQAVKDADDFVQGLKRHWLLRSAFKTKPTNAPPRNVTPVRSPKNMP